MIISTYYFVCGEVAVMARNIYFKKIETSFQSVIKYNLMYLEMTDNGKEK